MTTQGPKLRAGFKLPPVKKTPTISATNNAMPIPTGARNVALCFSAASMKTVKTSKEVRNISRKTPRAGDIPALNVVLTDKGPGTRAWTTPAAAIPASICATKHMIALGRGTLPMR